MNHGSCLLAGLLACTGMAVGFDFAREPFTQFKAWFDEATKHEKVNRANVMSLTTATADGFPSARMVVLKQSFSYGPEGFTFYTNYGSRKASELDANPRAALLFYWEALNRQIRVEGKVYRVPDATEEALQKFGADWGGYRVEPSSIEFYQGYSNKLFDRLRFRRATDGEQLQEWSVKVKGEDGWLVESLGLMGTFAASASIANQTNAPGIC